MMHSSRTQLLSLIAMLATASLSLAQAAAPAAKADVVKPAASVTWEPGPVPGTKVSKLWGDWTKGGAYGVLIKFDAGVMHGLHSHAQDLKIVVLSGTFVHIPEGGKETKLGPGSYLMQAGGMKHTSGCAPGAECEFFMAADDKFDMTMADGAAPAAAPATAPAK